MPARRPVPGGEPRSGPTRGRRTGTAAPPKDSASGDPRGPGSPGLRKNEPAPYCSGGAVAARDRRTWQRSGCRLRFPARTADAGAPEDRLSEATPAGSASRSFALVQSRLNPGPHPRFQIIEAKPVLGDGFRQHCSYARRRGTATSFRTDGVGDRGRHESRFRVVETLDIRAPGFPGGLRRVTLRSEPSVTGKPTLVVFDPGHIGRGDSWRGGDESPERPLRHLRSLRRSGRRAGSARYEDRP